MRTGTRIEAVAATTGTENVTAVVTAGKENLDVPVTAGTENVVMGVISVAEKGGGCVEGRSKWGSGEVVVVRIDGLFVLCSSLFFVAPPVSGLPPKTGLVEFPQHQCHNLLDRSHNIGPLVH